MKKLKSALASILDFMILLVMTLLTPVWFLIGAVMQVLGKERIQFFGWDLSIRE